MKKIVLSFACLLAVALLAAQTTILPKTTVLPNTTLLTPAAGTGMSYGYGLPVSIGCTSGSSSCTSGICASSNNCTFPSVAGAANILSVYLTSTAQITSAYWCNTSSGCTSGNATATFSLCPQTSTVSNCKAFYTASSYGNDLAYLLSAPSGSTYLTVNLSATQSATWSFTIYSINPPSGYSFSALDSEGASVNTSCNPCTLGTPTLSGTDFVFNQGDWNGSVTVSGPLFASPYVTDQQANAICLDCNTTTPPVLTQNSGSGMVNAWMALKTTAGTYTLNPLAISIANHALPSSGTVEACTPACPAYTPPTTTSGNLLRIFAADDSGGHYISSVSGCGTWTVPASCQSGSAGGSLQGSCAYNLSATASCTGPITVTMTGSSSYIALSYWEIHKTSGSWTYDTSACTLNSATNTPNGQALSLNNTTNPHAVFQDILDLGGIAGATLYPWTFNSSSTSSLYSGTLANGTDNYFASDLVLLNTKSAPAPVYDYPETYPSTTGVCADSYY